jgi:transcriptional regulator with XRE-family HTH domain
MDADRMLYTAIGELVRLARKRAELSQEELAQRVKLTRTSISNIERGTQRMLVDTVYAIADALSTSVYELLPATPPKQAASTDSTGKSELKPEEEEWVERVLSH